MLRATIILAIRGTLISICLGMFAVGNLKGGNVSTKNNSEKQSIFYQAPKWSPRATMPYEEVINNDFWPPSPPSHSHYRDASFSDQRLADLPEPGVHPRVLLTPSDVDLIREKIKLGDSASREFKTLWKRETKKRGAFYALVTQNQELGKRLAQNLMTKVNDLIPKLDLLEKQPDHENLWSVTKSMKASGLKNPPSEIFSLLDYDYLHAWLNLDERELIRKTVARITKGRYSNFLNIPDHFMINNHQNFGLTYLRLILLIEGQEGFNQRLFKASVHKQEAMLNYFISPDGMCYESIKGWLNSNAIHAITLRDRKTLKHSHLQAKMDYFAQALRYENGNWLIRDEMRASAFHVIWMMRHYRPQDHSLDLLYHASLNSHPELTDLKSRWRNPVGMDTELMLLFAKTKNENLQDWTQPDAASKLNLPNTWKDDERGYLIARNSWKNDDLKLGFACKQDFYYGGHEGSEANRFTLWSDGVNWARDVNMLSAKATWLQNMMTIDGKGLAWPPCPGVWMGVEEGPHSVSAAGDAKIAYSYSKHMQTHALEWESTKIPYYGAFIEKNHDLSRDMQVAFHPKTIDFNHGYAHTDYGPWSGETRLVEHYIENNPVRQMYRSVHLAKGKRPYVLVVDDADKDGQEHLFEWNMTLPNDVELLEMHNPEVKYQRPEAGFSRESILTLTRPNTPRDPKTGDLIIKRGDPLCMVKVLWRNSAHGFPIPRLQRFDGQPEKKYQRFSHLCIPAISASPEFRVLIYPYRHGDPLPQTKWNHDRTRLDIILDGQVDTYHFAKSEGGRTVFSMERNQELVQDSAALPGQPKLSVRGTRFNPNDWRTTRNEGEIPTYLLHDKVEVKFQKVIPPAYIAYTLDGSEPTEKSTTYDKPIILKDHATLKARHFDPNWIGPNGSSKVLEARFVKTIAKSSSIPKDAKVGVWARVYEMPTQLWNDKGFFDANKIMLPNLDQHHPTGSFSLHKLILPHTNPKQPKIKQSKGFYRFRGWMNVEDSGVHRFFLDSCGPVSFRISGQRVIDQRGIFHQHQKIREGEASLERGWHLYDLVICDPQYWNINSLEPMPFSLKWSHEGGTLRDLNSEKLIHQAPDHLDVEIQSPRLKAQPAPRWIEQGAILSTYSREGLRDQPEYLDIDGEKALHQHKVNTFLDQPKSDLVMCYDGLFFAPETGIYTFHLPYRTRGESFLGAGRNACQNQLRIDDAIVVQHGVYGRHPTGSAKLDKGWHKISLRLGRSSTKGSVDYPDGSSLPLHAIFHREVRVCILPKFAKNELSNYEIYEETIVNMSLPAEKYSEIRYTTDGSLPHSHSPLYAQPIKVNDTMIIHAAPFQEGKQVTTPSRVEFKKLDRPQWLNALEWDFQREQAWPMPQNDQASLWIHPKSFLEKSSEGLYLVANMKKVQEDNHGDVNLNLLQTSKTAFSLDGLKMKKNALSMVLYFKTPKGEKASGTLISKHGYNAYGKGYRTIKLRLAGGRLRLDPGAISSTKRITQDWNLVVITVHPEEFKIYLNGELVAKGMGHQQISSDSFDFFTKMPVMCRYISVFNRILSERDILALGKSLRAHH